MLFRVRGIFLGFLVKLRTVIKCISHYPMKGSKHGTARIETKAVTVEDRTDP